MDEKRVTVDIEEIMRQIRREIKMNEDLENLPAFEDIPLRGEQPAAERFTEGESENWEEFYKSLEYANNNYVVPYFWVMGPRGLKTFIKRVVRKLNKCLVLPIVDKQSTLNAMFVRCHNAFRYFSEDVRRRLAGHDEDLRQAQSRADALEARLDDLAAGSARQNERLEGLRAESEQANRELARRQESILGELAQLREQMRNKEDIQRLDEAGQVLGQRLDEMDRRLEQRLDEADRRLEQWLEGLDSRAGALEQDTAELRELLGLEAEKAGELKRDVDSIRDIDASIFDANDRRRYEKYSQSGEDSIIALIFGLLGYGPNSVSYLDLGANHARDLSNTYYFYQHGASGVLVEANPDLIPELKLLRRRDTVLHRCVSDKDGETVDFYVTNNDGLSSSARASVEHASAVNEKVALTQTVKVKTISVRRILEEYFDRPPALLNIDVEGCEMDILRSYDFERYRPFVIVVEVIPYENGLVVGVKNREIIEFLQSEGYVEYAFTGVNSIFIDGRKLERLRKGDMEDGLLSRMRANERAHNGSYGICIRPGGFIYGPYVACGAGTYALTADAVILDESVPVDLEVTAAQGKETLFRYRMKNGRNEFVLDLPEPKEDMEFVIQNVTDDDLFLTGIRLEEKEKNTEE